MLILDEPLNGLDPDGISWFRAMVRDFAGRGGTVLLSSHLLAEVSHTVDDVVVIAHGRLLAASPLSELGATVGHDRAHAARRRADRGVARGGIPRRDGSTTTKCTSRVAPDAVGLVAAHEGVVITGLSEQRDDLEDLFRDLTNTEGTRS